MDPSSFDRLSRIFAASPSRRTALAGLAGAVTGALSRFGFAPAPAQAQFKVCRPFGKRCFPDRGLDCCHGATCQSGVCRCPKRTRRCGNRCLPKSRCCRHNDCPGNQRCAKGRCQCPAGKKRCQRRCIARDACCGCGADQTCEHGTCVARRCGTGAPCRVFVTSELFTGNLGGIAGGDQICQAAANGSALTRGGIYKAWISGENDASSPSQRFTNLDTTGPYLRVDDVLVANDWDDLITDKSGNFLRAPLNVTELGTTPEVELTRTGTTVQGTPDAFTCEGWTTDSGIGGNSLGSNAEQDRWTSGFGSSCLNSLPLYCFEQR